MTYLMTCSYFIASPSRVCYPGDKVPFLKRLHFSDFGCFLLIESVPSWESRVISASAGTPFYDRLHGIL